MKIEISSKRLALVLAVGAALSGAPAHSASGAAVAAGPAPRVAPSGAPAPLAAAAPGENAVMEWNRHAVALTLMPSSALSPVKQTRAMAIVQVSVHDAVSGIIREYETYLPTGPAPAGASPDAAAIAAAHHALSGLFSAHAAALDTLYVDSLAAHEVSPDDPGIAFGRSAAAAILALRADDGSAQAQFDYTAPGAGAPGVWTRIANTPAQLPGWGSVTPWVLRNGSQFRPDAPPALDSNRYAADYNEVIRLGARTNSTRTDDQTQIAQFWLASPTAIWNNVLRQMIVGRGLDLSATARVFGLFYLAGADASVACWEAKYHYNFWRPETAIRDGDLDGNDATLADTAWEPFVPSHPHPEYPSGHTVNSAAMAKILSSTFGNDPGVPIAVTISGVTRQWDTFREGVLEVIDARVYAGIHFRTADEAGARLGREVAQFVSKKALRPCGKAGSRCR